MFLFLPPGLNTHERNPLPFLGGQLFCPGPTAQAGQLGPYAPPLLLRTTLSHIPILTCQQERRQEIRTPLTVDLWADVGNEAMHAIAERWASGGTTRAGGICDDLQDVVRASARWQPDMFMTLDADGTMYPNLKADPHSCHLGRLSAVSR